MSSVVCGMLETAVPRSGEDAGGEIRDQFLVSRSRSPRIDCGAKCLVATQRSVEIQFADDEPSALVVATSSRMCGLRSCV